MEGYKKSLLDYPLATRVRQPGLVSRFKWQVVHGLQWGSGRSSRQTQPKIVYVRYIYNIYLYIYIYILNMFYEQYAGKPGFLC